jgi:type IV pilus assembly protein PilM
MGLFGADNNLGVDFGHASVRVVGVRPGKVPVVTGCAEVPVDSAYLQKEGFENHVAIAHALQDALHRATPRPLSGQEVYATISESLIFRKLIELPAAPSEEELAASVRLEAVQYLPESAENMNIDYQVLGVTGEGQHPLLQVMIIAVSKRVTQDFLSIFTAARLTPRAFEPKPESVARAILNTREKKAVVLVDIGRSRSTISVSDQGIIRVTSVINAGTAQVLENGENDPAVTDPEVSKERITRLVGQLSDEIEHVSKFFQNRTVHTGKIEEVYLAGAGSLVEGMSESLARAIELPVGKGLPVIAVPESCDRRFYGALGVALYSWAAQTTKEVPAGR